MENSSTSQALQDSPIAFPPDAFSFGGVMLTVLGVFGVLLISVIASVAAYLTLFHGSIAGLQRPSIPFVLAAQALIDAAIALFLLLTLPAIARTSLRGLGFRVPDRRTLLVAVGGAVAMVVVVNGLGSLIETLTHSSHQQEAVQLLLKVHDPMLKLAFAGIAIVIAPIGEELCFRIFVFNAVKHHAGFWAGAIVSGIFFGLAHTDLFALLPLVLGGIILCGVYAQTRNAWSSMITHALFNSASVIALYALPQLAR